MHATHAAVIDPARLDALHRVLGADRPPGRSFDPLTRLAARVLHAPVSLVSLVDTDRELIRGSTGLPEPWATRGELPLDYSFCRHLVASGEPLLIEDARRHPWVRGSPAIRELEVIAYAGVPLCAPDGAVLGALCVIDHLPRRWVPDEVELLDALAGAVQAEIERLLALGEREGGDAAEWYRALVERSLAGIFLLRGDRIAYANPRLRELLGYPPGDPLSDLAVSDLVAEEDRTRVQEGVRRRMEGELEDGPCSFRARRRDGSIIDVEVLGRRAVVDGGPALVGTLLDVTGRREEEARLRESAERLRLVERATEDVVWEWTIRTGEVRWSDSGARMFRYRPEEVGTRIEWHHEHIHPDDRERVVRGLQAVLGGVGEFWSAEYRFRRGDGQYATVLDRGYVQRSERGEPVRVIGSMMDVTERKREAEAQRFLSRASELLDSSLDSASVLAALARLGVPFLGDFVVVDLVDDDAAVRRVAAAHVDPRKEALLLGEEGAARGIPGQSPVARVLRTGESVYLPTCDAAALEALGYTAAECEAMRGPRQCSLLVAPLVVGESILGAITVGGSDSGRRHSPADLMLVQDLARRAALAVEHARLYHQATEAVRARDELLGVVSHDLRNPLSAIQMSTSMLQDLSGDRRSENQRWLDVITRTVDQMSAMIEDLLDVSTIEAGHFLVQPSSRSVADLVRDASDLLVPLALAKGVRFETRVEEGPPTVWIDARQILRVISNLVGNAVKFTSPGGVVTLRIGREESGEVRVSVSDTGPGISAEELPHVFDRYWQARPGDRRGAGLGLAIARGIVEAHGGQVRVEAAEGEGTTFSFTLPAEEAARGGGPDS